MREILIEAYLDYLNNYLCPPETYAKLNGLSSEQAHRLLELGREIYESQHPEALKS